MSVLLWDNGSCKRDRDVGDKRNLSRGMSAPESTGYVSFVEGKRGCNLMRHDVFIGKLHDSGPRHDEFERTKVWFSQRDLNNKIMKMRAVHAPTKCVCARYDFLVLFREDVNRR